MINDIRFLLNKEQPLDAWVLNFIAEINDIMYDIFTRLNQAMEEVDKHVS